MTATVDPQAIIADLAGRTERYRVGGGRGTHGVMTPADAARERKYNMVASVEQRLLDAIFKPDAFDENLEHAIALLNPGEAFEEWWPAIEHDWRQQKWPTFKDMAHAIFLQGFRDAVLCVATSGDDGWTGEGGA